MIVVLASASPRRRDLLNSVGIDCVVQPAHVDESIARGEPPAVYVARVARAKADATPAQDRCVLAADTIVELEGRVLGKPQSSAQARAMLRLLVGAQHAVTTAFVVVAKGQVIARQVTTEVVMRAATGAEVDDYVAAGEWRGKAGGYAVQGMAAALVAEIRGSYTNVVGLPLAEVIAELRALGIPAPNFQRGTPA